MLKPAVYTYVVLALPVALAQKTTNFTYTLTITGGSQSATSHTTGVGIGAPGSLGPAVLKIDLSQPIDPDTGNPLDTYQGTISFVFNRLDSFDVGVTIPNGNGNPGPVNGNITNGKGAYQGATGTASFTITGVTGPRSVALAGSTYSIAATGNVTVGGKTTALTLPATTVAPFGSSQIFRDMNTGTANFSPLGSATFTLAGHGGDNNTRQSTVSTVKFNANDSILAFITFIGDTPPPNTPGLIIGGTGAYAGATGSITLANVSLSADGNSATVTGSGSVTTGASGLPVITDVSTAFGNAEIAPNGWMVIKGANLVPRTTPAAGVIWSNAPDFAQGKMPTNLQGISVSVNGIPAYVYFYCSAATDPSCSTDQINVLAPLDAIGDNIPAGVVVTNGSGSSVPFIVNEVSSLEPSFLLFDTKGHVVGVHLDASLLGPTGLYPGLSTPAKAGETVLLFAIGFGLPTTAVTQGSSTQSGPLPGKVGCFIGTKMANVAANIISPGLTQLNVTIPAGTPTGDNLITCGYGLPDGSASGSTPAGNLITVQ